eukprot:3414565-Pyramimonas_sp.AAC.1
MAHACTHHASAHEHVAASHETQRDSWKKICICTWAVYRGTHCTMAWHPERNPRLALCGCVLRRISGREAQTPIGKHH